MNRPVDPGAICAVDRKNLGLLCMVCIFLKFQIFQILKPVGIFESLDHFNFGTEREHENHPINTLCLVKKIVLTTILFQYTYIECLSIPRLKCIRYTLFCIYETCLKITITCLKIRIFYKIYLNSFSRKILVQVSFAKIN